MIEQSIRALQPANDTQRALQQKAIAVTSDLLKSRWLFKPHPDGTQIDFELEFDFRSLLLQKTVQLLFAEAVRRMVSAFEARAAQLYGKPVVASS